jgi:small-conductance mechanosensitive channel/CRP-like cAMP-binding protein
MFESMQNNLKFGLFAFGAITFALLLLLRLTRQTGAIRAKIRGPLFFLYGMLLIDIILYMVGITMTGRIESYFYALLYLVLGIVAIRFFTLIFFDIFLVRNKKYRAPKLLKEIASVVLFGVVLVIVMQNTLDIKVTTLLATSALITVVLGLALQETLGNLFAGLALQLDPPYRQGDWIRFSDIFGRVEEVTWRATKLKTINNDFIVVPNGEIAKERVINHSYPEVPHATRVNVGVSYSAPPNRVAKVVQEAMEDIPNVLREPLPDVRLKDFQDSTINYEIKFFIRDFGLLEPTLAAVRKALWYHLRRNDIEIPFPIRNVYMHGPEAIEAQRERILKRLAEFISDVELFAALDDGERLLIAEQMVELRYAHNELIIREGEKDESFFIIEKGTVEVYLVSPQGSRKALTTLGPGEFFGEMALLTGQKRTANVRAVTDVRVYRLDKDSFKEILERKPEILDDIGTVLSRRKDQIEMILAESSGSHEQNLGMNSQVIKQHILSRIRSYFGL